METPKLSAEEIIKKKFSHFYSSIEEYEKLELLGEGTYGEVQ